MPQAYTLHADTQQGIALFNNNFATPRIFLPLWDFASQKNDRKKMTFNDNVNQFVFQSCS